MNTDKIYAEQIANEYAPKQTSKVKALKRLDVKAKDFLLFSIIFHLLELVNRFRHIFFADYCLPTLILIFIELRFMQEKGYQTTAFLRFYGLEKLKFVNLLFSSKARASQT